MLDRDPVKGATAFTYFGRKIGKNGNANENINARIGRARAAYGKANNMVDESLSVKT